MNSVAICFTKAILQFGKLQGKTETICLSARQLWVKREKERKMVWASSGGTWPSTDVCREEEFSLLTNIIIKTSKQKEFLLWRCHRFYLPHKEIKKKERSKEEILNGGTGIIYRNVKGRRIRNRQKRFWSIILLGRPPPTQNEKKKRRRENVWSLLNLK